MNTPHKYVEVIKAWADGEEIQFKHKDGDWTSLVIKSTPNFNAVDLEWRIKPEILEYRIGLVRDNTTKEYSVKLWDKKFITSENYHGDIYLIKWLSDWQTIEVDQSLNSNSTTTKVKI